MKFLCIRFAAWIMLPMLVPGCSPSETEELEKTLAAAQEETQSLQAENRRLSAQSSDLQSAYLELKANCENLQVDHKEMLRWSRELVRRFGPSVWHPGTYEKPVPYKQMPGASAPLLARELNLWFKRSHIPGFSLDDIRDGTAQVSLEAPEVLTQKMGTTGASGFLNAIVFTLCSLESIDCVDFNFPAGPHASPGRYCP